MAVLFISPLCPDRPEYHTKALNRSGNNVLLGIANRLYDVLGDNVEFLCIPCVPSYPNGKFWIESKEDLLDNGGKLRFLPTLNVKILKSKLWGIQSKRYIKEWAKRHKREERKVLIYNTYHPSVKDIYKACKETNSELYAILYDLGVPPKRLKLSWLTMLGYRLAEKQAFKYIPQLTGRIVINENIVRDYAPKKDFLLVDGGINQHVSQMLFPLKESTNQKLVCVCAGMLWDQNGTQLILETLKQNLDLKVIVQFAGNGIDVPMIEEAAKTDNRIQYLGMLTLDKLFKVYEQADVLFNLRLEEEVDYHFPSKLLECLATGKHVISTPVSHAERDYGKYVSILKDRTASGLAYLLRKVEAKDKFDLYEQGVRAREFMLCSRNWDIQTDRILDYMKENR